MDTGSSGSFSARSTLVIFLLAFFAAWSWNSWNISVMRDLPGAEQKLRHGRTVATADDISYLRPAEDLLRRVNGIAGVDARVVRSPGYGLHFFFFRLFLPPASALHALALMQVLFFAFSVALLWYTLALAGAGIVKWVALPLIVLLPAFHGFLFYTLTEGVTPAYVLVCACCALCHWKEPARKWLMIGGVAWALLILTRPVLGWAGLPLLLVTYQKTFDGRLMRVSLLAIFAMLPLVSWITLESIRSGYLISPHPVYRPEATNIFRPTHKAFWDLGKSWGMKGEEFHVIMEHGFQGSLGCLSVSEASDAFISSAPAGHLDPIQTQRIQLAFLLWGRFNCDVHARVLAEGSDMGRHTYPQEQKVVAVLGEITRTYRSDHPLHHHFVVPAGVMKDLIVHSNLNLYIFQHTFRGLWWMEILRWFSLVWHVLLLTMPFIAILLPLPRPVWSLALLMCAYLLFLAYVQRGVEERYTLPVLHASVLLLPFVIHQLWNYLRASNPRAAAAV